MSDCGEVWSIKSNRFIHPEITRFGYKQVTLAIDKKPKRFRVHRLVALLFIPNPNNYPCVNHIDGNKMNNCVSNLEWCTYAENNYHARINGLNNISKSNSQRWKDDSFREKTSRNISRGLILSGNVAGENNGRFRYHIEIGGKTISRSELSNFLGLSLSYTDVLIRKAGHGESVPKFKEKNIKVQDTLKESASTIESDG